MKFKIRIKPAFDDLYTIQYSEYRWFPIFWKKVYYWFDTGAKSNSGLEEWSIRYFDLNEAEDFVSKIKSVKDIDDNHNEETKLQLKFLKEKFNINK